MLFIRLIEIAKVSTTQGQGDNGHKEQLKLTSITSSIVDFAYMFFGPNMKVRAP